MAAAGLGLEPLQAASSPTPWPSVGRLGLEVDDPLVLKDSLNLLVWLRPAPVVARIQVRTGLVRDPEALRPTAWRWRGTSPSAGLPVSPPVDDIDPGAARRHDRPAMTLWRHLDVRDEPADPAAAGRSLRAHARGGRGHYDGPLRHVGRSRRSDGSRRCSRHDLPDDAAYVTRLPAIVIELPDLPIQALHGDAHLGNVGR